MAQQLKEHFIAYLESVQETPGLPTKAKQELSDALNILNKTNHIILPDPTDSRADTVNAFWKIMNNFFTRYPDQMNTAKKIDAQEQKFQKLVQDSELLVKNKPSSGRF